LMRTSCRDVIIHDASHRLICALKKSHLLTLLRQLCSDSAVVLNTLSASPSASCCHYLAPISISAPSESTSLEPWKVSGPLGVCMQLRSQRLVHPSSSTCQNFFLSQDGAHFTL
jgi:hypothetical protein